jgi:hypothetical protein
VSGDWSQGGVEPPHSKVADDWHLVVKELSRQAVRVRQHHFDFAQSLGKIGYGKSRLIGILLCHRIGDSINPLNRVFGPFFRKFVPGNCEERIETRRPLK